MAGSLFQRLRSLEPEEQILNGASVVALVGVFLPWASGHMLGSDRVVYSGLGFYTSFVGISILLIHIFVLLITLLPLAGGPILIRKQYREYVRLFCGAQATVLVLAALSVLAKVTFEFSRMEIRFGIFVAFIGSVIVLFYGLLRVQEQRRSQVRELFHHPEDSSATSSRPDQLSHPRPPPPPSAPQPEDHRLHLNL